MSVDLLLALAAFAFVTSVTPGPNNLMLLASGATFGFRRTIPHMLGIGFGFVGLLLAVGFGLGQLFEQWPALYTVLKYVGTAYMLYLAWKVAHSGPLEDGGEQGRPMTFLEAAAFQFVNPKAWIMGITAMATYTVPTAFTVSVLLVALVFGLVNVPSVSSWALFGMGMRRLLSNPRHLRLFNLSMALLLVASLWPVFVEAYRAIIGP